MKSTSLFPRLRASAANAPITLVHKFISFSAAAVLASSLGIIFAAASTPSACAQTVTFAAGGAVNFGSANVCPSGKTAPAPCSKTLTLTYNVTATGTLGTSKALTTGAPNLDYRLASGSTCTGSVTQGTTCTVNVTFAPIAPGARNGAVEIVDSSGNVVATTYIYGSGVAPLIGFGPPAQLVFEFDSQILRGIAVDASGNAFIADSGRGDVKELLAVDGSLPAKPVVNVLSSGYNPYSVAVDGAGNVFFTDYPKSSSSLGYVREILAAGGYATTKTIGSGFSAPYALAVDGSGNVFVTDQASYFVTVPSKVKEILAAGDYATTNTLGGGFAFADAYGITVDGSGNVFVAEHHTADGSFFGIVEEILAAGDYSTVNAIHVSSSTQGNISDVAVDPAGNLFVGFQTGSPLGEFFAVNGVLPAKPAALFFGAGIYGTAAIALDGRGNIFIADNSGNVVEELPFSTPPSLNFDTTSVGYPSTDSPRSVQIENQGNATLDVAALSVSTNWDQVPGSGTPADCAASFSLVPGAPCNLSISFKPTETGTLTGAAMFVDNSLNASEATQSVGLSGTAISGAPPPRISSLSRIYGAPGSLVILTGTSFGGSQGSSTITLNGLAAPVSYWSDTSVHIIVPANATSGNIVASVRTEVSNAVAFTVEPEPGIFGISPPYGPPGTVVTISGQNLIDAENHTTVSFSGKPLPLLSLSSTAIQVAVPAGAVSGPFDVVVDGVSINTMSFGVTIQPPTVSGAGSKNFGSANLCPSGKTTPAPCSDTLTLTYNIPVSGSLGTPKVLTAGAPNLDFTLASPSTCTGSVTAGTTCTVNVTFAPTAPGLRSGAVEIFDSAGRLLTTTYLYGKGVGPLLGSGPTLRSLFTVDYYYFQSTAVDGSGNLFFAGGVGGYCAAGPFGELLAVGGSVPSNPVVKSLPTGSLYNYPAALALDGAGNIFLANDSCYGDAPANITEILAASGYTTAVNVGGSFNTIGSIAVDSSGNLFVIDFNYSSGTPTVYEVLSAGGYTTTKPLGGGFPFKNPAVIALDGSGNVFVADSNIKDGAYDGAVEEILASSGYTTVQTIHVSNSENQGPMAIAVNAAGDAIVSFESVSSSTQNFGKFFAVDGVLPASPAAVYFNAGLTSIGGVTLDAQGNIFTQSFFYQSLDATRSGHVVPNEVAGWYDTTLQELSFSTPPSLNFADTYVGHTSSDSPQSIGIVNNGNADLDVTAFSVTGPNFIQVAGPGSPKDCTASFSLVGGAECNASISFEPKEAGSLTGAVKLVDNAFNTPGSAQSVPLSGEGLTSTPPQITGLSTPYGAPYSVVEIFGTNFGASQGSSTVTFNGIPTLHYQWSNTKIYVTVPAAATTGNIVVTVGVEASNGFPFTVYPMPVVTGISPSSGPVRTPVTIIGRNLLAATGLPIVTFNGQPIPVIKQTPTALYVAVPEPAVSGSFHVLVNDTGIDTPVFTVTTQPEIVTGAASADAGTANVCASGKTAPAPCSQILALTYKVVADSTLGAIKVLTTGQPNLDYTLASGSTCTGSVTAGTTCTVKVTFAPIAPGARNGAVQILDGSGTVTRTTFLHGTGIGPQIGFGPPALRSYGKNLYPYDVAVDASGNVFVADFGDGFFGDNKVDELLAVNGSLPANPVVRVLGGFSQTAAPISVALDGAGNVFYAPYQNGASVQEIPATDGYYPTAIAVGVPLTLPVSVAVDGSGNVFVIDNFRSVKEMLAAGGYTTTKTLAAGFQFSVAAYLAVDGAGNLFVVDINQPDGAYAGIVDEILAAGDYTKVNQIHVNGPEHSYPNGIAVDPAGNLYVSYYDAPPPIFQPEPPGPEARAGNASPTPAIGKVLAVNGVVPPHPDIVYYPVGTNIPYGIALDGRGNVYVGTSNLASSANPSVVQELQFSTPPGLNFAATAVGQTSSDSPQSTQIQNNGNAPLDLTTLSISANWDQAPGSGTPEDCAASLSLLPAAQCNLSISFKPTQTGALTGAATFADNSLNTSGATQSIPLSGTGLSSSSGAAPTAITIRGRNLLDVANRATRAP